MLVIAVPILLKLSSSKRNSQPDSINLNGGPSAEGNQDAIVEPAAEIEVSIKGFEPNDTQARSLLGLVYKDNVNPKAIVGGHNRVDQVLQQSGYFFAEVRSICSVTPEIPTVPNGTVDTCRRLSQKDVAGRHVNITYEVDQGSQFTLRDIRIQGTTQISYQTIAGQLLSKKAPEYGRGITSSDILDHDKKVIENKMRALGYTEASVEIRQGTNPDSDDLIVTFVVNEGPRTSSTP